MQCNWMQWPRAQPQLHASPRLASLTATSPPLDSTSPNFGSLLPRRVQSTALHSAPLESCSVWLLHQLENAHFKDLRTSRRLSSPLLAVRPVAPSAFCRSAPQRTDAMRCDTMRCEWSTSASLLGTRSRSRNVCHIPSSSTVWWYFEQLLWIWIDCYKLVTEKKRHDCYWDVINAKSAKIEKRKVEWRVDDR